MKTYSSRLTFYRLNRRIEKIYDDGADILISGFVPLVNFENTDTSKATNYPLFPNVVDFNHWHGMDIKEHGFE